VSEYIRVLRNNPDFARLWIAQVISLLGDWFNTIVLSALVSQYTNGSGLAVSGFLLARFIPPLVISPFAGVLVDRFDRKRLLIISDMSRAIVVLLLLLANSPEYLWLIYVLTVIQFCFSAVFDPGRNAIMPSLLPQTDLVIANTLSSVTWSFMLAVGAIIGGVVAALFGTATALLIDACSFAISALFISQIRQRPEYSVNVNFTSNDLKVANPNISQNSFMDGLRYVAAHPTSAAILLVKFGQSIGNVDGLLIIYATKLFVIGEGGTTSLSLMYAAFGFGAVIGPILLNRFNDGSVKIMRRLIIIGYVLITLGWVALGGANSLLLVCLALVLRAMGGSSTWTYSSVIIQKNTPDNFLGRLFSLDQLGFQFATVITILITGWLLEELGVLGVRPIVFGTAVVSLVPLLLWIAAIPWMEKQDAGQAMAVNVVEP
jgi:MFS family permease